MICENEIGAFSDDHKGFEKHKRVDHDIWLYVYYIKYLLEKDHENYNGDELKVYEEYNAGSIGWMPKGMTRFSDETVSFG
jgi:hypothetical protein